MRPWHEHIHMIKDQDFYNKESAIYSAKRYPERATDYTHFFFKKRLSMAESLLRQAFQGKKGLRLLEIGCADGIVMREIGNDIPGMFSDMTGIDTAEDMIAAAISSEKRSHTEPGTKRSYYIRGKEPAGGSFDAIVEIGVANYTDLDEELGYISEHLKDNGICVLSIAGKWSVNGRMSREEGYRHFSSYGEYENKIVRSFIIEMVIPVGLRLPFIWRIPMLARKLQPFIESIWRPIAPDLFHEKIYLLRKKPL